MPATGMDKAVRQRGSASELPQHLENDFDRQALVPRLLVLAMLAAATLLEYGHWEGHWIVLVIYGLTTIVLALSSRFAAGQSWLPWVVIDTGLVVYVTADHLPRDTHGLALATDAVSLLPAFLLLIQTGLRLRRDLGGGLCGHCSCGIARSALHACRLGDVCGSWSHSSCNAAGAWTPVVRRHCRLGLLRGTPHALSLGGHPACAVGSYAVVALFN